MADIIQRAKSFQEAISSTQIHLLEDAADLHNPKEDSDLLNLEHRDPAVLQKEVNDQLMFVRKLKFQYQERNAKDRYVKAIVSDIEDAPMITAEDNQVLLESNKQKKEELAKVKKHLAEKQASIRELAPKVEQEYNYTKRSAERVAELAQQIIDARLALSRLRRAHPHPRLTVDKANDKLEEQIQQMQQFTDDIENAKESNKQLKRDMTDGEKRLEVLRTQRTELARTVKEKRVDSEDDGQLVPLYDWLTRSLVLHRALHGFEAWQANSDNEVIFTYNIAGRRVNVTLIFHPDTRRLLSGQVDGLGDLDDGLQDVIDSHVNGNNPQALVAAIKARAWHGT